MFQKERKTAHDDQHRIESDEFPLHSQGHGHYLALRDRAEQHGPYVLRLTNPRKRSPASSHRFVSAGHRDKYVVRCIESATQIDRHVTANFYPTPPEATRALLSVESFDGPIWEPACGQGHIAKVLKGFTEQQLEEMIADVS